MAILHKTNMTSKEFDKINAAARRKISKKRGWQQSTHTNWIIKGGYYFCLENYERVRSELIVKPLYVDDLWWEIIKADIKLTNSLRRNSLFTADFDNIGEINVFPNKMSQDYSIDVIEETWNRVFCEIETEIDKFVSGHPDPKKYVTNNHSNEVLFLVTRMHNEMHKEVLDYIANILVYRDLDSLSIYMGKENVILKTTYDYILEWYELHYPEILPQNLIDKIIRN